MSVAEIGAFEAAKEVIEESFKHDQEVMSWVKQLCAPIENKESETGQDPRYDDLFVDLKAAVEKKQEVDFKLIAELAEKVISRVGKDVRAAGYYLLAASKLEGVDGLYKGVLLLSGLIERYGESLYPLKEKARNMALRWPFQTKVLVFAQKHEAAPDYEAVKRLQSAFEALGLNAKKLTEDFGWPELVSWLGKLEKQLAPKVQPVPSEKKPISKNATNSTTSSAESIESLSRGPQFAGISGSMSDAQLMQLQRQLLGHYREKKEFGTMASIARALKWGDLKLPLHENFKTRVPAPREASLNRIRHAYESENWLDAFLAAEDAFMEPGGLFSFEIQRWSATAAQKAGLKSVYMNIESLVHALLTRLPNLKRLSYEDGSGFLSGSGAAWYEQIENRFKVSTNSNEQVDYLAEARTKKEEKGLAAALVWLKQEQSSDLAQQLSVQLAQASLCHEEGLTDAALALLNTMDLQAEEANTEVMRPDLAMAIWRQKYLALKDVIAKTSDEETKVRLEKDLIRLQSLMCSTDVAQAIEWL